MNFSSSQSEHDNKRFGTSSIRESQLQRCAKCSMIFYSNDMLRHECMNSISYNKPTPKSNQIDIFMDFPFFDEVKRIWKQNGYKKHTKPLIEKKTTAPIKQNITKNDFSFSPYDNYF